MGGGGAGGDDCFPYPVLDAIHKKLQVKTIQLCLSGTVLYWHPQYHAVHAGVVLQCGAELLERFKLS